MRDPFCSQMIRLMIPWAEAGDAGAKRAKEYLHEQGFRVISERHGIWEAARGSIWNNPFTFNLRKIRTTVRMYRKGDFLVIKYHVCTFMQTFSEYETDFFNLEMAEVESLATNGEPLPAGVWDEYKAVRPSPFRTIGRIAVTAFIVILLSTMARFSFAYISEKWSQRDRWPTAAETAQLPHAAAVDVFLIPLDGFPEPLANELANWLSHDMGINVKALPAAACDFVHFDSVRKQYVAESFYDGMYSIAARLPERNSEVAVIFLTEKDIYMQSSQLRFVFAVHGDEKLSLVATGRYAPNPGGTPPMNNGRFNERTLKLIKRAIGIQLEGRQRSSNSESLMVSPLLSLEELDQIQLDKW